MIRARALWVLATIASRDDGDLRAARVSAYASVDPLVRGWVRGAVQRAVAAAAFETSRADDERHVHRLAYLRVHGELGGLPDDVAGIAARFDELAPRAGPARRGPTLALLGALASAAVVATVVGYLATREAAPLRAELPPSRGAWAHGGRPEPGGEAVREVFERGLPAYVVALDALRASGDRPERGEALAAVERAGASVLRDAEAALGPIPTSHLRTLIEQSTAIVTRPDQADPEAHVAAVEALNAAVAAEGLAYYVDSVVLTEARTGQHRAYLSTFTVERVRLYRSGETRVRALRLQRLDHLSFARSVLGFTRPEVADALVLEGRIEGHLVDAILPALAVGARMPLVDEASRGEPWAEQVETLAAADARAEAAELLGPAGQALGELFRGRQRILDGWERRLAPSGLRIVRPRRFDFDVDDYESLGPRVPSAEMRELRAIVNRSREEAPRTAYRRLEQAFVESIERHEVQHRLDYGSGRLEAMPPELEAMVGPLWRGGRDNPLAQRAIAELSAYLAELARGPAIVKTNLALFAQHALHQRSWGSAECYAGLVVLEGLATELGVTHSPLVAARQIDRAALVDLYVAVHERDAAELSGAARALYARLFGRALDPLVSEA